MTLVSQIGHLPVHPGMALTVLFFSSNASSNVPPLLPVVARRDFHCLFPPPAPCLGQREDAVFQCPADDPCEPSFRPLGVGRVDVLKDVFRYVRDDGCHHRLLIVKAQSKERLCEYLALHVFLSLVAAVGLVIGSATAGLFRRLILCSVPLPNFPKILQIFSKLLIEPFLWAATTRARDDMAINNFHKIGKMSAKTKRG
jgi:hypothetical protein